MSAAPEQVHGRLCEKGKRVFQMVKRSPGPKQRRRTMSVTSSDDKAVEPTIINMTTIW